ncbi:MAG: restriction endonuclease subunit S [Armatimonadetes bacterium]|nr:restriction endonuclease subunit S [Armatimonadota bacterium]
MKLKPGYKQTEVGVIPEGWEVRRLGMIAIQVASGKSKVQRINTESFPIYGSTGIIGYTENPEYEGNAILVARVGANAGTLNMVSGRYGVTDNTIIIRINESASLPFIARQLEAQRLNKLIFGSGQPLITGTQLKDCTLPLPPLPEQHAIAEALSDMDALLAGLEKLIAKKRALKQATMQQLLTGATRLSGFRGEWEVRRVGEIGQFLKGSGVTKDQTRSGIIACVRYGELYTHHHNVVRGFHSWISPDVALTAVRLKQGDILFAGSGETKEEIGKCAAFVDKIEAYAGGDIVILRTKASDPIFLGYYLNTAAIVRQKSSRGQGDAVVHISSSALSDIVCKIPPLPEQRAIAEILSDMDAEIEALELQRKKTVGVKQGMMQELLTGRVRLV